MGTRKLAVLIASPLNELQISCKLLLLGHDLSIISGRKTLKAACVVVVYSCDSGTGRQPDGTRLHLEEVFPVVPFDHFPGEPAKDILLPFP